MENDIVIKRLKKGDQVLIDLEAGTGEIVESSTEDMVYLGTTDAEGMIKADLKEIELEDPGKYWYQKYTGLFEKYGDPEQEINRLKAENERLKDEIQVLIDSYACEGSEVMDILNNLLEIDNINN